MKALAISADGSLMASGSFDYSAMLWSLGGKPEDTGTVVEHLARFDDVDGAINAVAFLEAAGPDASLRLVIGGDDGKVRLFDTVTQRPFETFSVHADKINAIDISPDGTSIVTASWDRTARILDLTAAIEPVVLEGHRGPVNAAVFTSDGAFVITAASDGALRQFDRQTGRLVRAVLDHGWGINVLKRLPDGRVVYGGTDGSVVVIDLSGQTPTKSLAKHDRPVLALAYRSGRLASAGGDGGINVWNAATLQPVETFKNPFGPIWALAFSADARTLYYGGLGDAIHIWQVTPRKPFEAVESDFPRRFQVSGHGAHPGNDPVERGRIQFARKCSVCHTLGPDGRNRAGPTLYRIFGRRIASVEDYRYSEALKSLDIVWTPETVARLFEVGPDTFTPGSKMPLQKMSDPIARADLIAYLKRATRTAGEPGPSDVRHGAAARAGGPADASE